MNIVLIGYRGTGKSSVGKRLARTLKVPFYDTDGLVEIAAGRSIGEMVAENGWACFRKIEKKIVQEVAVRKRGVVASGGGAVMDEENAGILKRNGIVIWLDADVETIIQRICVDSQNRNKRPPLTGDDLYRETVDLLKKRSPVYRRLADFSVNTAGKRINEVVDEICQFLRTNFEMTALSGKE